MKIIGYLFLFLFFLACSKESEKPQPTSIVLSSNRSVILGNGEDEAILTVVDERGNDITATCSFQLNGVEDLAGSKFKIDQQGTFQLKAMFAGIESNVIVIKSVDKMELEIKANKDKIWADNIDGVALKLMSNLGEDLTASASFYVGNEEIKDSFFATKSLGSHRITARYGGMPVENSIAVHGVASTDFPYRILAEDFTSVACFNCPGVTQLLDMMRKKHSDVVVAAWHNRMSAASLDPMEKHPEVVTLRNLLNVTVYPTVVVQRQEKWDYNLLYFDNYPRTPAQVGIALDCRLEKEQVQIVAKINGASAFPGARYGAFLLEDGILFGQIAEFGYIASYTHNDVVRETTDVKGELVDIPAKEVIEKSVTLPWKESYKKEKCRVVFFVMGADKKIVNVQTVAIDKRIGY